MVPCAFEIVSGWWGHQPGQSAVVGVPTDHNLGSHYLKYIHGIFSAVPYFCNEMNKNNKNTWHYYYSYTNSRPVYFC